MESTGSKLFTFFPILFLLLSTLSQPSSSSSPADSIIDKDSSVSWYRTLLAVQRNNKNQIPNCAEMVSRSQCLQNPKCRWCHSEALDDMCFSRAEAWRLPQQMIPLQSPSQAQKGHFLERIRVGSVALRRQSKQ